MILHQIFRPQYRDIYLVFGIRTIFLILTGNSTRPLSNKDYQSDAIQGCYRSGRNKATASAGC